MIEYRWATEADYKNIIDEANHAFDGKNWTGDFEKDTSNESFFPRILPKLYQNIRTAPMHVITVEDGKIVGCVGNFVLTTKVADETLNVIGIGTVSTHPDTRRAGHMKKMMAMSLEHAKEVDADFMVLGGQRQRYEHWGFGRAGINPGFGVTLTNMRHIYGADADFGYEFRELTRDDQEFITKERLLRKSALTSTVHERDQEFNILFSMDCRPYVITKDGEFFGTFMYRPREAVLHDLRLMDDQMVARVVNDMLKKLPGVKDGRVAIDHIPPYEKNMIMILSRIAEDTQITGCQMIKILNYERTLRAYMKMAAAYRPLADGEVIMGFDNGEVLKLSVTDGVPAVEPYAGMPPMLVSELEAVNMMFDVTAFNTDYGYDLNAAVRSWFPLPFFQYMSDEV